MNDRFPEHWLDHDEVGIFDPTQGFIRCEQAVLTAIARARALGANVQDYSKVRIEHSTAGGVLLTDGQREWRAKKAIVTTGSWSQDHLDTELRGRSRPGRIKLTWFSHCPGTISGRRPFRSSTASCRTGFSMERQALMEVGRSKSHPAVRPPTSQIRMTTSAGRVWMRSGTWKSMYRPGIGRIAADMLQGKIEKKFQFMDPSRTIVARSKKASPISPK